MTQNKFGIIAIVIFGGGWLAGALAGHYLGSKIAAASVAFLVPAMVLVIAGGPIGRAWWSINRLEAAKADFQTEARQSLSFVILMAIVLSVVFGITAYLGDSAYQAAFAGMMLSMGLFSALRRRDVSARKLS